MGALTIGFSWAALRVKGAAPIAIARCRRGSAPNVIWVVVPPAPRVEIMWADVYGVFAGPLPSGDRERIRISEARYPAEDRASHVFACGRFGPVLRDPAIPARHFEVRNETPAPAGFGLLQAAVAGERIMLAPVNAVSVAAGSGADLVPEDDVLLWSDPGAEAATLLTGVPHNALYLSYSGGVSARRCYYDSATGGLAVDDMGELR